MADYREEYRRLLQSGITVFEALLAIYTSDKQTERDWADLTLVQTHNQRNSLAERLAAMPAQLAPEETGPVIAAIGQYLDSHWADYQALPTPNPEKRAQVEKLHAQLEEIGRGIGQLHNEVKRF